jgi:restriction endonuclease Mrr
MEPRNFEFFIKDLLLHCGFLEVCVTRFSADGGVDVNARAGGRIWIFENTLVQVQAKRWLHSVGRKEVAELRGSYSHSQRPPSTRPAKKERIQSPLLTALGSLRLCLTKNLT